MTSSVHVPCVGVTAGVAGASSPKRHAATTLKETQVLHAHIKRRRTRTSLKACRVRAGVAGIARGKMAAGKRACAMDWPTAVA